MDTTEVILSFNIVISRCKFTILGLFNISHTFLYISNIQTDTLFVWAPYEQINKPERIPFITTYNPSLPSIFSIKKHYNLLLSSDRCKNVFLHLPVVAFRRSPNLRDLLVTAKLSPNVTHSNRPYHGFRRHLDG